ncbi:MAG: Acyl-coenzyme A thioesterase PaaI, contains HGG motif [Chloroflexi bacterium]|nr:MAG: Acyl-coenzyme A thioesterase PaaI, contains HGG motif [Chloroflexota bacterium]
MEAAELPDDARFDPLREMQATPLFEVLGLRFSGAGEGWAEVELASGPNTENLYGIVHGGVWLTLADAAMGAAISTVVPAGTAVITVQSEFRWLRALRHPSMRARGEVLRRGRSVNHVTVELRDPDGAVLAQGSGSYVERAR